MAQGNLIANKALILLWLGRRQYDGRLSKFLNTAEKHFRANTSADHIFHVAITTLLWLMCNILCHLSYDISIRTPKAPALQFV
jgi:hypothetical protein